MYTSFITLAIIIMFSVIYYRKKSYNKRFKILGISLLAIFVVSTITNIFYAERLERRTESRVLPLIQRGTMVDTISGDTIICYSGVTSEGKIRISHNHSWVKELFDSTELIIIFIEPDSLNIPRYERTREQVKEVWFDWYCSQAIPARNKKSYLYLPETHRKFIQPLYEEISGKDSEEKEVANES